MNLAILVGGLATGAVYSLVAVGIVVIFRATGVVNFAQGSMLMTGGFAYLLMSRETDSALLQLLVVVAVGCAVGLGLFAVAHLLMRQATEITQLIGTLAVLILLESGARLRFGDNPTSVPGWLLGNRTLTLPSGDEIPVNSLVIIGATLLMGLALHTFFRLTQYGKAVRAVAESPTNAALTGIPVKFMLAISWVLGGVLTSVGGMLLSPVTQVYPSMGAEVLFPAFLAAVLGGFNNILGSLVGGLAIGLVQTVAVATFGGLYQDVVVFVVMLVILLVRPRGLLADVKLRQV